jgi:hypothetical protein
MSTAIQSLSPGAIARQDALGGSEIEVSTEVQAGAMEAQARAEVQARWAIAQRSPRNLDAVRVALLKECDRPGFAEVAKYAKPVDGKSIIGPSIRFVETALRCMRNVIASTTVIAEDRRTRRLQVMVTDLETNVSWPRQITVEKTVERKIPKGRDVLSERTNSYGEVVYLLVATEDEFANKEASAVSKAIRQAGLRVIPGDIIEEALARVEQVRALRTKADPSGARKKLVDAFVAVGVGPERLAEYLGHSLDLVQPAEIEELRDIHAAIRDGETRWAAVMEQRREADPVKAPEAPRQTPPTQTSTPAAQASTPQDATEVTQAVQPVGPEKAQQTPPAPDPVPLSPSDELLTAIERATKPVDLNPLASRIGKLSDADKGRVMAAYSARAKALRGAR